MKIIESLDMIEIPENELIFQFVRSSGPGGQNVNKVNSKAQLTWHPQTSQLGWSEAACQRFLKLYGHRLSQDGGLLIYSMRHRDQKRNAEDCVLKLKEMIQKALIPPKKRKPTKPTKAAKEKRLKLKKQHSEKKKNRGKLDL